MKESEIKEAYDKTGWIGFKINWKVVLNSGREIPCMVYKTQTGEVVFFGKNGDIIPRTAFSSQVVLHGSDLKPEEISHVELVSLEFENFRTDEVEFSKGHEEDLLYQIVKALTMEKIPDIIDRIKQNKSLFKVKHTAVKPIKKEGNDE